MPRCRRPGGGFNDTNNFVDLAQQVSLFYGGKIFGNVGAFAQVTYSNSNTRTFNWDNTDIRYADTTKLFNSEVLYGVTVNNNPSVQDVWNTTPAWSSPFITSPFGSVVPAPLTMMESWGPGQTAGAGGYVFVNDMFYAELTGYQSLTPTVQSAVGDLNTTNTINGVAPYCRLAIEPTWGDNSWEIGAYGMAANIIPGRVFGTGAYDKIFDAGFDTQYQWISDMHAVTLRGNYIWERQILDATSILNNYANTPSTTCAA